MPAVPSWLIDPIWDQFTALIPSMIDTHPLIDTPVLLAQAGPPINHRIGRLMDDPVLPAPRGVAEMTITSRYHG